MSTKTTKGKETGVDASGSRRYRCPQCELEFSDEILTRVHVTRSDDDAHENLNGMMPETTIEVVSDTGEITDEIERQGTVNPKSLDRSIFPDEFPRREQHILQLAAYYPNEGYKAIYDRGIDDLAEHDLEPVSYGTVRRWIREFYTPQLADRDVTDGSADDDTGPESLSTLTAKQQAIVVAYLDDPDASNRQLAERAGCSAAYPSSVLERASSIVDRLVERIESGQSLEDVLAEELSEDERDRLADDDLLGPEFLHEQHSDDSTGQTRRNQTVTDGPVNDPAARIMSAIPESTDGGIDDSVSSDDTGPSSEDAGRTTTGTEKTSASPDRFVPGPDVQTGEEGSVSEATTRPDNPPSGAPEGSGTTEPNKSRTGPDGAESKSGETVSREEIVALRERIRFVRRIAQEEVDEESRDSPAASRLALARVFERELDLILET